jgi:pimeloyl-ACP methyl ester carboxylesterase
MHKREQSWPARIGRWLVKVLLSLLAIIVIFAAVPVVVRAGYREILKYNHTLPEAGIDLMETVQIGGIDQALYFRGENRENPVLLFIHGGPGSPMMPFLHCFQYDWESKFTVVQWDQRQAGKTYWANDPDEVIKTLSLQRMVDDAWEVTQYIQQKLNCEKIIVLGHSWGTILGSRLVLEHPEAFYAYISVGQVVDMRESTLLALDATLLAAQEANATDDIQFLESCYSWLDDAYDQEYMQKFAELSYCSARYGFMDDTSWQMVLMSLGSPYYTLSDVYYFMTDTLAANEPLVRYVFDEYNAYDSLGLDYQVPVFYIMGAEDYQTSVVLAREYFDAINAPVKAYYEIPAAQHMLMLENPTMFNHYVLNIVYPQLDELLLATPAVE